jgi:S1-C subfamily serine protease
MMTRARFAFVASAIFGAGFFGALVVAGRLSMTQPGDAAPQVQAPKNAAIGLSGAPLPDLSNVAERALKASVNMSSTTMMATDTFTQFLGGPSARPETSLGSGVIVSDDGYILTNSHVVQDPQADVVVTLPDGRVMPAKVRGMDPTSDLAVVKVNATGLSPLPWADSSKLRVGEWVLAIGNPLAFSQTVTQGIVSATSRHEPRLASYSDLIQTDAAINRGNSGGALVNARGELIGINSMMYSETGGYQGLGFAIPSNLAHAVMTELIEKGEVARGSIGLADTMAVSENVLERYGYGRVRGVAVRQLYNGTGYRAGLRTGDVIVAVNGKTVSDPVDLERMVLDSKIGSTLTLDIARQGPRRVKLDVEVAKLRLGEVPVRR